MSASWLVKKYTPIMHSVIVKPLQSLLELNEARSNIYMHVGVLDLAKKNGRNRSQVACY